MPAWPSAAAATGSNLEAVPEETGGPYPGDGADLETPTVTGSVADGYAIAMTAAIST